MLIHKLKLSVFTLLFLGVLAAGAGYLTHARAMKDEPQKAPPAPQSSNPKSEIENPKSGRMFVVGRVLDPQGKPVPGATVMASAQPKTIGSAIGLGTLNPAPIGQANSDGSGRFRIDAPRTSSSRYDQFGAIALAPGYGIGWIELDPDVDEPAAEITLRPEQVIQGRLFDIQGRAAQGVMVSVWSIRRVLRPAADSAPDGTRRSVLSMDPRQRHAGLAQAGGHRRRGPVHPERRRPWTPGLPGRHRPAVRHADDRGGYQRYPGAKAALDRAATGQDS